MSTEVAPRSDSALSRIRPVLILLAVMWIVELIDAILPATPDQFGIQSRTLSGLVGIPLAPFLHAGFSHLLANSIPLLILGSLVSWRVQGNFWRVTWAIILLGGAGVWLFGPGYAITIGASGLVFGYLAYLIAAGLITRHWLDLLVSVGVLLIYGGTIVAVLPFGVSGNVSWQAHLFGAAAGVLVAFAIHDPGD